MRGPGSGQRGRIGALQLLDQSARARGRAASASSRRIISSGDSMHRWRAKGAPGDETWEFGKNVNQNGHLPVVSERFRRRSTLCPSRPHARDQDVSVAARPLRAIGAVGEDLRVAAPVDPILLDLVVDDRAASPAAAALLWRGCRCAIFSASSNQIFARRPRRRRRATGVITVPSPRPSAASAAGDARACTSPSHTRTARSMTFCSSRTFPGQW